MADVETEAADPGKLVEQKVGVSLALPGPKRRSTKKRAHRRLAEPHLRKHQVKGKTYYYYCRGADREIYLGDAGTILMAVAAAKRL
ncbi:MAG: hypothetical protein A2Z70_01375 [Chloroflexi bacterium RBG_13_48_17]|nr:MAG: hypothetical protein A2Z70_01375 [Chloroflexi bacterium RBG_13_48_17]